MTITKKEIAEDFKRFIRHEAMRANITQDEVMQIIAPKEHASEQLEEEYRNYLKQAQMEHKISHSETVAAIYFASYEKNKFINKACEWLLNNIRYYSTNALGAEYMCNDFRKAMED